MASRDKFSFGDEQLPTFRFGDASMYEDGILQRVGKLSRSVQQEFEENEGGAWLQQLSYVTEHPAKEEYPSSKGEAPSEELKQSYTRDLRNSSLELQDFYDRQPELGNGPGQIPKLLTKAEVAILRMYTGPWFKCSNFYLRYLPEVGSNALVAACWLRCPAGSCG